MDREKDCWIKCTVGSVTYQFSGLVSRKPGNFSTQSVVVPCIIADPIRTMCG